MALTTCWHNVCRATFRIGEPVPELQRRQIIPYLLRQGEFHCSNFTINNLWKQCISFRSWPWLWQVYINCFAFCFPFRRCCIWSLLIAVLFWHMSEYRKYATTNPGNSVCQNLRPSSRPVFWLMFAFAFAFWQILTVAMEKGWRRKRRETKVKRRGGLGRARARGGQKCRRGERSNGTPAIRFLSSSDCIAAVFSANLTVSRHNYYFSTYLALHPRTTHNISAECSSASSFTSRTSSDLMMWYKPCIPHWISVRSSRASSCTRATPPAVRWRDMTRRKNRKSVWSRPRVFTEDAKTRTQTRDTKRSMMTA